jgi:hypothetical protein
MTRFVNIMLASFALFMSVPVTAVRAERVRWNFQERVRVSPTQGHAVPELEAASAGGALMLIAGGTMLLRSNRKKSR